MPEEMDQRDASRVACTKETKKRERESLEAFACKEINRKQRQRGTHTHTHSITGACMHVGIINK